MDYRDQAGAGMLRTSSSDAAIYSPANVLNFTTEDAAVLFRAGKLRAVAGRNRTREIPRHPWILNYNNDRDVLPNHGANCKATRFGQCNLQ